MRNDSKTMTGSSKTVTDYSKTVIVEPQGDEHRVRGLARLTSVVSQNIEEEERERQQWTNPLEFLLSCVAMSVGLGNIWRFPFVAYQNGGGAFLIPYLIVLLLVSRPLFFLEVGLGQFCSRGSISVWDMAPGFRGLGYGMLLICSCLVSYYCYLIALCIYYLAVSFTQSSLPWTYCSPQFTDINTVCVDSNTNKSALANGTDTISAAEQYYIQVRHGKSDITDGLGVPDPTLAGCLLICWLLLYYTLRNGVKSAGRVAYFTATFPYIVLIIMLVKGLTLDGATNGLIHFFKPEFYQTDEFGNESFILLDPKVWYAAVTQAFFSLSIGMGINISYSSYNRFRQKTYRDALIVSIVDSFTSILAGTVIFTILGHMSHQLNKPIKETVATSGGPSLVFIAYPQVLATFEVVPQIFSILFYTMFLTLGIGSATGLISGVVTVISDAFPKFQTKTITKVSCLIGFCLGLMYVTEGGMTILDLVDTYTNLLILILATIEVIVIGWVYGTCRIMRDFEFMLNTTLGIYWKFCWGIFCPILLAIILGYDLTQSKEKDGIPLAIQGLGMAIAVVGFLLVLLPLIVSVVRTIGKDKKLTGIYTSFQSSEDWGPKQLQDKLEWSKYPESKPFWSKTRCF